jgi:hypothetical protein
MKVQTILATAAVTCMLSTAAHAASAYRMPLRASDLAPNERYSTRVHSTKNPDQIKAHDIGAQRHNSDKDWTGLRTDDADKKILSNWVVYGKPFYAMAPGTVVACWRNAPENVPGKDSRHPDYTAGNIPGGGNHLWVLQDDGAYALYAHAMPGTIPTALCPHNDKLLSDKSITNGHPKMRVDALVENGARVVTGQRLGQIGNSGSSGGPHLHVHMVKDGEPRSIMFERGMTTPFPNDIASLNGPWTRLTGKALPAARILVWAPRPIGNYTFNGVPSANYQRMVEHLLDSGMMPSLITCASNGSSYDSKWVPAKGKWASFHGMSAADAAAKHAYYTSQGYKRTSSYTCGTVSVAVWRK